MEYSNLKISPHLIESTLKLIESALEYQKPNSFAQDFYPIFHPSNFENNHLLINDQNEVCAHIAVKLSTIIINQIEFPLIMLGGIAVEKKFQGQGLYKKLMADVLNRYQKKYCFALLWSDLDYLYRPFDFYQVFTQFQLKKKSPMEKLPSIEKTKLNKLTHGDKIQIQNLYKNSFCSKFISISREKTHWKTLEQIESADLFIRRDLKNIIGSYFFQNKGQDLQNIIYEYGTINNLEDWMIEITNYGEVWSSHLPQNLNEDDYIISTGAYLKILNTDLFSNFIRHLTSNQITHLKIETYETLNEKKVKFNFKNDLIECNMESFLQGILGPNFFEDFNQSKPIFISGIDSI